MKITYYTITKTDGEVFPGAMFGDGVLIDSRTGEPCKFAASWTEISYEEFSAFFSVED